MQKVNWAHSTYGMRALARPFPFQEEAEKNRLPKIGASPSLPICHQGIGQNDLCFYRALGRGSARAILQIG